MIYQFGVAKTKLRIRVLCSRGEKIKAFAQQFGFRLIHSSLYYAQANGQVEAINKVLIEMIKKVVEDKLRRWHEVLAKVIWAYKNSKNNAIGLTPYRLTYGQDAILPLELTMISLRVAKQHKLQLEEYCNTLTISYYT